MMARKEVLSLHINGHARELYAPGDATLLTVLRDDLSLTAAKRGCNQGVCGACTVMVDDAPVRSCLTLAGACAGRTVTTLEGFGADPVMQALQEAMIVSGAVQCGFCTSGMLVTARDLLAESPVPDEGAIRAALSGNLCRCTGYTRIVEAVQAAARALSVREVTP
jgi:aerobic-type carbon monoxide dehydrogenase small subunit (CoxS/CutS family)